MNRREVIAAGAAAAAAAGLAAVAAGQEKDAPIKARDPLKVTKLETFLVQPRWLFLKVHTNAGIVGLGEPVVEGRAETVATAVKEIEAYLIGKDPRQVAHHWQAIYRHAFYRGGRVLTSALSGIDMALWDIKGKALGVPVYELLGGPTRSKVRLYLAVSKPADVKKGAAAGFTAFKTNATFRRKYPRYVESPSQVGSAVDHFAALRKEAGDEVDVAIDFHGKVSPALAKVLIKGLEPLQPMFVEEPINCQNHDIMAEIARGTHLPIATGERVFTKWGFREVLEKKAATILQPDLCHAGGITEVRLIAGMAEAYYASIAPHNPLGLISLAAGLQLAASIPNFLCQEHRTLGEGYLKEPFVLKQGFVDIPTGPGLGIELDENAVAGKIGHQWHSPESYDEDDGSAVDW
jgi:galactonate dehydratase